MNRSRLLAAVAACSALVSPAAAKADAENERVRFEPASGAPQGYFGRAVALGSGRAFVAGTEFDDDNNRIGVISEFVQVESGWIRGEQLRGTRTNDSFGMSVAVDDDVLAVSSPGYCDIGEGSTPGFVHVFRRIDGSWQPDGTVQGPQCWWFGVSVDIAGDVLVVGSTYDHGGATGSFVYERIDGTWTQTAHIRAPEGSSESFGAKVATDGTFVVLGDSGENLAVVYARAGGTWEATSELRAPNATEHENFGTSLAIDDGVAVIGAPSADADAGAAYVFEAANSWGTSARLVPSAPQAGSFFGWSVAIDDGSIAAGARAATVGGNEYAGAAYAFQLSADDWIQLAQFEAGDAAFGDSLGTSVSTADGKVLSGAWLRDGACGADEGVAYLFDPQDSGPAGVVEGGCWAPTDRRGPLTSVDGPVFAEGRVTGVSVGRAAPVTQVFVDFAQPRETRYVTLEADVACDGLDCVWSVEPPEQLLVGVVLSPVFEVRAYGIDQVGNTGATSPRKTVVVLGAPTLASALL